MHSHIIIVQYQAGADPGVGKVRGTNVKMVGRIKLKILKSFVKAKRK